MYHSFLSFFTYMIFEIIINYSKKFHYFSVPCVYSLYFTSIIVKFTIKMSILTIIFLPCNYSQFYHRFFYQCDNFSVDFNVHDDFHLYIGVCYYESSFQDINKYIAFCPIHRFLGYITILCRILNNTDVTLKTCFISAFQSWTLFVEAFS